MLVLALSVMAGEVCAQTYMRVKSREIKTMLFDVEGVEEVDYVEKSDSLDKVVYATPKTVDGVTVSGKVGDYEYVDMGLPSGTLWATCNVGAKKPTDFGGHFGWGCTSEGKDTCFEKTDTENSYGFTVTIYSKYSPEVDGLVTLLPEDDAATVNMGASWRMPSIMEMKELVENCYTYGCKDYKNTGVEGFVFISYRNGNVLFLPAAGCSSLFSQYELGYWSSSLRSTTESYILLGDPSYNNLYLDRDFSCCRDYAYSVRAVCK